MGFFKKIFSKTESENINTQSKNTDIINETKRDLFLGKNREEIKKTLDEVINNNNFINIDEYCKKIKRVSLELNYDGSVIESIVAFLNENRWLSSRDYLRAIEQIISCVQKDWDENKRHETQKVIDSYKYNIEYLNNLKSKEVLFLLETASLIIFIYSEEGTLKIVNTFKLYESYIEYDILDINFIYDFFKRNYLISELKHDDALYRYHLLNTDLDAYISEYFKVLKDAIKKEDGEYGFYFSESFVSVEQFINQVKTFVFISNLTEFLHPLNKLNIERSFRSLNINSENKLLLPENAFERLIRKNQSKISEIDRIYIHNFVKLSSYINKKKENTLVFFGTIDKNNFKETPVRIIFLEEQIQIYDILLFHSVSMVGSLMEGDLVSFYEIHEVFDKLGIFNSNWENEVSGKLSEIGESLNELIDSVRDMERNIVSELSNLTYVTQESFKELNTSVTKQLQDVESSLNFNNLLTGIQTYQLYKINKNTKPLQS